MSAQQENQRNIANVSLSFMDNFEKDTVQLVFGLFGSHTLVFGFLLFLLFVFSVVLVSLVSMYRAHHFSKFTLSFYAVILFIFK